MEKKYYYVHYSNVNVEGELELSKYYYLPKWYFMYTSHGGYYVACFVKEYKQEARYREKEISDRRGTKKIKEEYFVTVGSGELTTYVEEVDGKYYDIITGIEAIQEEDVDWPFVEKKGEKYYYKGNELDKNNVESKELKFIPMECVSVEKVYNFLKNLTDKDIELYNQRMKQALANIPKVQVQRMSKVSQKANEQKAQEDYISKFRENNGFGRYRTR